MPQAFSHSLAKLLMVSQGDESQGLLLRFSAYQCYKNSKHKSSRPCLPRTWHLRATAPRAQVSIHRRLLQLPASRRHEIHLASCSSCWAAALSATSGPPRPLMPQEVGSAKASSALALNNLVFAFADACSGLEVRSHIHPCKLMGCSSTV